MHLPGEGVPGGPQIVRMPPAPPVEAQLPFFLCPPFCAPQPNSSCQQTRMCTHAHSPPAALPSNVPWLVLPSRFTSPGR